MGKATQRRESRLASDLQRLAETNPRHFIEVWQRYLSGWCDEIVSRGRAVRRGVPGLSLQSVFDIHDKAERLLDAIGPDAERMVGAYTRDALGHEFAKAVAAATDSRIYLLDTDSVYRLMMTKRGLKKRRRHRDDKLLARKLPRVK